MRKNTNSIYKKGFQFVTMMFLGVMIAAIFLKPFWASKYPPLLIDTLVPGGSYYESLTQQQQITADQAATLISIGDMDKLYWLFTSNEVAPFPSSLIERILECGYLTDRIDGLKASGHLRADYVLPGTTATPAPATETQPTQTETPAAPAKTEFTVEDVEPYQAWATNDCNVRAGADTTWEIIGGLKKHDAVTVTGKASTGSFRVKTDTIAEGYVANGFLTTNDPYNQTLQIYDPSTGTVDDYSFPDTPPEVVEQAEADIRADLDEKFKEEQDAKKAEEAEKPHEHSYEKTITKEPTCKDFGEVTFTCECGDTYTETIGKSDHTPGEWEVSKAAGWTTRGERVQKCSVCGEILDTEEISANPTPLYVIIGIIAIALCVGLAVFVVKKRKR